MTTGYFLYSKWLSLELSTRIKLANQFGIVKRGSTEVFNNTIKSDGYVIKEIEEALNIDAIQKYLGVRETDMLILWMWMIDKIEGREFTQPNVDTTFKVSEVQMNASIAKYEKARDAGTLDKEFPVIGTIITSNDNLIIKPKRGRPAVKKQSNA